MSDNSTKLLTRAEAATYLGVRKSTLEVWASTGRYKLPFIKIGSLAKYRVSDLDDFINSGEIRSHFGRD